MTDALSAVNWAAIISAVGLLGSMIGGMLTIVYKLIVANMTKTTALYDERVQNVMTTFQQALESRDQLEIERIDRHKQQVAALMKRQEKIERELRDVIREMPKTYMAREDFLKSVTVLEVKMDRIGEHILYAARESKS